MDVIYVYVNFSLEEGERGKASNAKFAYLIGFKLVCNDVDVKFWKCDIMSLKELALFEHVRDIK